MVYTHAGTWTGLPVWFRPVECLYSALKIFLDGVTLYYHIVFFFSSFFLFNDIPKAKTEFYVLTIQPICPVRPKQLDILNKWCNLKILKE